MNAQGVEAGGFLRVGHLHMTAVVQQVELSEGSHHRQRQAVLDFSFVAAMKAALNQESVYMQQMEVNVSFI